MMIELNVLWNNDKNILKGRFWELTEFDLYCFQSLYAPCKNSFFFKVDAKRL